MTQNTFFFQTQEFLDIILRGSEVYLLYKLISMLESAKPDAKRIQTTLQAIEIFFKRLGGGHRGQ